MTDTTIKTTIVLADQFSDVMDQISQKITATEQRIVKLSNAVPPASKSIRESLENVCGTVTKLAGVLGIGYLVSKIVDLNAAFSRMDTMNNYKRTMEAITGDAGIAKASLDELKSHVLGTAYGLDVAAKSTQGFVTRGMDIGNATNQVRIWADAVSFYSDGTNESLSGTIEAWQNMYATQKVTMDQLNRVIGQGIPVVEIYAKAVGKSTAQVMSDISSGSMSAAHFMGIVSKAMDEGTNGVLKIAGEAKKAGGSWATTFANMRAAATRGIISIIEAIDKGLAAAGMGSIMDNLVMIGGKIEEVFNKIAETVTPIVTNLAISIIWVGDNLSLIMPAIAIVTSLFVAQKVAILGVVIAEKALIIAKGITNAIMLIGEFLYARSIGATFGQALALTAQTAAQQGLNIAMYACPVTWIIAAIIALIGIVFLVVAAINKWTGTTYSATGIIAGAFAWLGGLIVNIFVLALNFILDMFVNPIIAVFGIVANFLANVFKNPIGAIKGLFLDLANYVIGKLKSIAQFIDGVFGSNLTSALNKWSAGIDAKKSKLGLTEVVNTQGIRIGSVDQKAWYGAGYKFGANLGDKFSSKVNTKEEKPPPGLPTGKMVDSLGNIDKNTKNSAKSNKALEEQIKYIKDYAERRAIQNAATSKTIVVDMRDGEYHISKEVDIDTLGDKLGQKVNERIQILPTGSTT